MLGLEWIPQPIPQFGLGPSPHPGQILVAIDSPVISRTR
jgi:hypothetical protein